MIAHKALVLFFVIAAVQCEVFTRLPSNTVFTTTINIRCDDGRKITEKAKLIVKESDSWGEDELLYVYGIEPTKSDGTHVGLLQVPAHVDDNSFGPFGKSNIEVYFVFYDVCEVGQEIREFADKMNYVL